MKNLGIKYQLRIITLIPVLLVALVFALFYNFQYDNDLKQQMSRLGEAYINQLLPLAQFAILRKDNQALQELIDASSINPEIKALTFYNAKGQRLAFRGDKHLLHHIFIPPPFTGDRITSKQLSPYSINFIAPITAPKLNLYSSAPYTTLFKSTAFDNADSCLGWLSIDMDNKFMLIKHYQMYISTLLITLGGLLIGLIIHYYLSRRVYQPIARLRRSMMQILSNEFETQINVSSGGELGIIEQGCSHLQKQHLSTIQDLNQHIEVATADLQQSLELLEEKNIELSLEKKKTEEKIRQKSEFIANMSHEIRTPMNGVIGFTNVLLDSKLDALQHDYVKTIKASAQDLLAIINDILDYSKIDAGKLNLDCIPLNIRSCIDEVLSLIGPHAHSKGIDLIPISALDVPKIVLGDPLRLKQIISNLISNAVKFTDYGYVLIRTSIERESESHYTLCLSVTDTGIGISATDQSLLFSAFNQGDTTMTRRYGGSGLGLVICKKLVEHMHGQVSIHSEIHKGSTFSVSLKLEKMPSYEIEKNQSNSFNNIHALCFDDNPLHLDALCNGLSYLGINCIRVHAFNQLEEAFNTHSHCQLAFINVNEDCELQIAHTLHKQSMPCLLISKYFISNYKSLGAQGLLFKPPNLQKLQDTIDLVLKNAQSLKPQPIGAHNQNVFNQYCETNNTYTQTPSQSEYNHLRPTWTLKWDNTSKPDEPQLKQLREKLHSIQPHLLIAEDNIVNQLLLNSLLKQNANIETVDNGAKSVEACDRKHFSIILLDLKMPILNGLDAARLIRTESKFNQNTPIILISANSSDLNKEMLLKTGINLCIQKPIDEKQLLEHILHILETTQTPAINWPLCIQKVSGNESLAIEFLAHFIEELVKNRAEFLQIFHHNDLPGLEQIAHKLHGACCFCGVPELQSHVAHIEQQAMQAQHVNELHDTFMQLITSIDAVLSEYEQSYRTSNIE